MIKNEIKQKKFHSFSYKNVGRQEANYVLQFKTNNTYSEYVRTFCFDERLVHCDFTLQKIKMASMHLTKISNMLHFLGCIKC